MSTDTPAPATLPKENKATSEQPKVRFPLPCPETITPAQRRQLRAQGHHLKPVVQIGQAGLSDGVIEATKVALEQHELIKVSINGESPTERKSGAEALAQATGSHVAQVIGRVILLYRKNLQAELKKKASKAREVTLSQKANKKSAKKNKR